MIKVLFVCMGNICRSPVAEGVFKDLISKKSLEGKYMVDSAGTHDYHVGKAPDSRMQEVAVSHGIDISGLKARHVCDTDFEIFDYILVMDNYNMECLLSRCPEEYKEKIKLFLSFASDETDVEVPDPFYGSIDEFEGIMSMVQNAAKGFLGKVNS